MKRRPILYVIAGSNGAGKTTFATEFLPRYVGKVEFINADVIAKKLSPLHPEKAAASACRAVLKRIAELSRRRATFAIETTLFGRAYARTLSRMRKLGYEVHIHFLWIPHFRLALSRIERRVRRGGHHISREIVRRRFSRTLWNLFHIYLPLADHVTMYDNSGVEPRTVAEKNRGRITVADTATYQQMVEQAENAAS